MVNQWKDQETQSLQAKVRELEIKLEEYTQGGIKILFSGKANAQRIARKVKPRTLREIPELSLGNEDKNQKISSLKVIICLPWQLFTNITAKLTS